MDRPGEESHDPAIIPGDVDTVGAQCPTPGRLGGNSCQSVPRASGGCQDKMGIDGHRAVPRGVGSQREGTVGQGKDHATMPNAEKVGMGIGNSHRHGDGTFVDRHELDSQAPRIGISFQKVLYSPTLEPWHGLHRVERRRQGRLRPWVARGKPTGGLTISTLVLSTSQSR